MTAGNKKKAIFDDEEHPSREPYSKPQSKKQKPLFQNEEDEDNGYNGFENFQDFNKFVKKAYNRLARKIMDRKETANLMFHLKLARKNNLSPTRAYK